MATGIVNSIRESQRVLAGITPIGSAAHRIAGSLAFLKGGISAEKREKSATGAVNSEGPK